MINQGIFSFMCFFFNFGLTTENLTTENTENKTTPKLFKITVYDKDKSWASASQIFQTDRFGLDLSSFLPFDPFSFLAEVLSRNSSLEKVPACSVSLSV